MGHSLPIPSHGPKSAAYPLARASTVSTFPPTKALVVVEPSTLPQGFIDTATCTRMPEPAQLCRRTPTEVLAVEGMTLRISRISASRIVQDNSTRSIYLDTIAASIGRIVLGGLEPSGRPSNRGHKQISHKNLQQTHC